MYITFLETAHGSQNLSFGLRSGNHQTADESMQKVPPAHVKEEIFNYNWTNEFQIK